MSRLLRVQFARYNQQAFLGAPAGGKLVSSKFRRDMVDSGALRVHGTTVIAATSQPISCKVRLFDRANGRLVRECMSGTNGTYSFDNLRAGNYFVVAHDQTKNYNAVIADSVTPEVMP